MIIIVTFILNSGLNFILGLLIARFLGAEEFGRYAIAAALAVVVNGALFDWIRLAATRFFSAKARAETPHVRASLDLIHIILSFTTVFAVFLLALLRQDLGLSSALIIGVAAMGVCNALFDYHAALARACFENRVYAVLVCVKTFASFALMTAAAVFLQDAVAVVVAFCASIALTLLWSRNAFSAVASTDTRRERLRRVGEYARYGVPLVIATTIYQLIPFLNRAAIAHVHGFAEAGQLSLASDIGVRLLATSGSAIDILLFQLALRVDEREGRAAAEQRIAKNITIVFAVLSPIALGYWLVLPVFEALFVPTSFRGPFGLYTTILVPALLAFGLFQFALTPVFQLRKQTAPVIIAAGVALLVNSVLLFVLPQTYGPSGYAGAQLGGYLAAFLVLSALAGRAMTALPSFRDSAGVLLALATMVGILFPFRTHTPSVGYLAVLVLAGMFSYGGVLLVLNTGGMRTALRNNPSVNRWLSRF